MSFPVAQPEQTLVAVPQSTAPTNCTINISDTKTVKVSNVSLSASEEDIKEFFSFSGDLNYVEMRRENEITQLAYVTFKETQGSDTAVLLSGATISGLPVTITPTQDYQLPPDAVRPNVESEPGSAAKKAEDVVSTMLAKGFVLGKDALNKAKAFDEQHQLTSSASAAVTSIDRKMGLTEKFNTGTSMVNDKWKEMDERFQVSEKTRSAYAVAEQKASSAGSAIMSNRYVLTGATWVTSAFSKVSKAAEDVSTRTKEKVERAEGGKNYIYKDRTGIINDFGQPSPVNSTVGEPPMVPMDSKDSNLGNI